MIPHVYQTSSAIGMSNNTRHGGQNLKHKGCLCCIAYGPYMNIIFSEEFSTPKNTVKFNFDPHKKQECLNTKESSIVQSTSQAVPIPGDKIHGNQNTNPSMSSQPYIAFREMMESLFKSIPLNTLNNTILTQSTTTENIPTQNIKTENILTSQNIKQDIHTEQQMNPSRDFCKYCKRTKAGRGLWKSHSLMDKDGNIICPILSQLICPVCQATGTKSHSLKFCPLLTQQK